MRLVAFIILWALGWSIATPVIAQTPPSAAQIANYNGLHAAVHYNRLKDVAALLARGADPNSRDGMGRTPAHVAAFAANVKALRLLVAGGADIKALESDAYDVITIAAVTNDVPMLKAAIELGGNTQAITSRYDGTALIAAAHLGHVKVVKVLIAAKAPLDHINNLGWTALMEAVVLGDGGARHVLIVKALLRAGADKSLADRNGVTPLDHARTRKFKAIIALLQ